MENESQRQLLHVKINGKRGNYRAVLFMYATILAHKLHVPF